jgi:hypothetical protein
MCTTRAFPRGGEHLFGLADIQGERLLAQDCLARARGGNRDLAVSVVRRADIDDVDLRIGDHLAPVG